MANNLKPANFFLRLLAFKIDFLITILPLTIAILILVQSPNVISFIQTSVLMLAALVLPTLFLFFFYYVLTTTYFSGTLGHLITGLRVTNKNFEKLTLKQSFFRYSAGYYLSSQLFGLGFWRILKDANSGFHDQVTGSLVTKKQNTWILGIITLCLLIAAHIFLLNSAFQTFQRGTLPVEFYNLINPPQTDPTEDAPAADITEEISRNFF